MSRKSLKFYFSNNRKQTLSGILDLPGSEPILYAVFAPCFTCTKESHAAHKISRALAERNIGVLRFDMTGLGESEGSFAETNFSTRILDIIAACHALGIQYQPPKLLIGHSISGTAAIAAAKYLPSLQVLTTLGSPRDPKYVVDKLQRHNQIVMKDNMVELTIAGRKINVKPAFIDDMLAHDVIAETTGYDRKLFIFHAPHDEIVSFENAQIIYDRATCDKELLPLGETSTHLLEQGTDDAVYIAETLRTWFDARLSL